jgi:hypothetical protein
MKFPDKGRQLERTVTITLSAHVADAICHCLRCDHWLKHSPQAAHLRHRKRWDVVPTALMNGEKLT